MSDATRPGASPRSATSKPEDTLRQAGDETKAGAADLATKARDTAGGLRDEAAGMVQDVKAEGASVAAAVQERAAGLAEEQKQAGAEQADSVARAVHRAADELEGTSPQIARYVHDAASSVDRLARALRDRSPGELLGGVEDLARRQPVAFFGAAVLAGFALARFAKSSAADARPTTAYGAGYDDRGTRLAYDTRPVEPSAYGTSGGSAVGGGTAPPRTTATGAPGWVPDPKRPEGGAAAKPATMAAASLGGAAARPGTAGGGSGGRTGPERQGG
jgi:hypothetical protein